MRGRTFVETAKKCSATACRMVSKQGFFALRPSLPGIVPPVTPVTSLASRLIEEPRAFALALATASSPLASSSLERPERAAVSVLPVELYLFRSLA